MAIFPVLHNMQHENENDDCAYDRNCELAKGSFGPEADVSCSVGIAAFLTGAMMDDYFLMCPCSPSIRHRADLVVLGDQSTDHSLSLKEEITTIGVATRDRYSPK